MPSAEEGPSVSVVIPSHERPETLVRAVASAAAQSRPCLEIIVVDDCSQADIAAALAEFGPSVRLLTQPRKLGANAARNAGVRAATGDLIAFLDDDDEWYPDKLARQIAALGGREACLCGQDRSDNGRSRVQPVSEVSEEMLRRGNSFCGMSGLVVRRRALLEEPLDETLSKGQDWDIYVRLAQRQPLAYVAEPLFLWRHGGHAGLTVAARDEPPERLAARARVLDKHRAWLGERHYRFLLASFLLMYVSSRRNPLRYLAFALRHAGPLATARHLALRALRLDRRARQR